MVRLPVFAVAACLISSSCFAASASRPLTASERVVIEHAIRAQLSDPDSAKFRHNPYNPKSAWYCGLVNAKNRMGGYVGYRLFSVIVADGDTGVSKITRADRASITNEDKAFIAMLTDARCSGEGYETKY